MPVPARDITRDPDGQGGEKALLTYCVKILILLKDGEFEDFEAMATVICGAADVPL